MGRKGKTREGKLVGFDGSRERSGISKGRVEEEFELQRISSAVAVSAAEGVEGGYTGRSATRGRQERVRRVRDPRCFVRDRLRRQGGKRCELSQQLSAQLGGFISIGTICCAK